MRTQTYMKYITRTRKYTYFWKLKMHTKKKTVLRVFFAEPLLLCANFTSQHAGTKKKLLKLQMQKQSRSWGKKIRSKMLLSEELQCAKATKRTFTSTFTISNLHNRQTHFRVKQLIQRILCFCNSLHTLLSYIFRWATVFPSSRQAPK